MTGITKTLRGAGKKRREEGRRYYRPAVEAMRAHQAETPKQTSLHLRLRALHFYPDLLDFGHAQR